MVRLVLVVACAMVLAACAPSAPAPSSQVRVPADIRDETPAFVLPQPNVVIEADPPPPFTYWAPEGATIRNHGNPGVWVAYVDGRNVGYYFGDQCRASEWQRFVGQPLSVIPEPPEGMSIRTSCTTCPVTDDLRPNRINVVFEEATQSVTEISCH